LPEASTAALPELLQVESPRYCPHPVALRLDALRPRHQAALLPGDWRPRHQAEWPEEKPWGESHRPSKADCPKLVWSLAAGPHWKWKAGRRSNLHRPLGVTC
jgi:hypothetical protein